MIALLYNGIIIGFLIAAPVGPVGVLCIRRTLTVGWTSGFMAGVGAALADSVFGIVAAFGLSSISDLLLEHQDALRLVGGGFLLFMGLRTLTQREPKNRPVQDRPGLLGGFVATFFLTITNPVTLLAFLAIFAASDVVTADLTVTNAVVLVAGVLLGSLMWWCLLTAAAGLFRNNLSNGQFLIVNRVAGVILVAFGVLLLLSLAYPDLLSINGADVSVLHDTSGKLIGH